MKVVYFILMCGCFEGALCENIFCKEENVGVCIAEYDARVPFSEPGERTAPKPECATTSYIKERDRINLKWKQKWTDINYVDGYYVEVTSIDSDSPEKWAFRLDKAKLKDYMNGEQIYATFYFQEIFPGEELHVSLYSMPMYQRNDTDHRAEICNEDRGDTYDEMPTGDFITVYPTSEKPRTKLSFEENDVHQTSSQDASKLVPLNVAVMACILSVLGVLGLLLLVCLLYFTACRAIERSRGRKARRGLQKKHYPTVFQGGKKKPKVLIVTNMLENADDCESEIFKRAALSLVNILYESGDYDVSCNLWMTKEIAKKGVALWAHETVRLNDKIVALCDPTTAECLVRSVNSDLSLRKGSLFEADSAVQILYTVIRSHTYQNKLIIACVNAKGHECLTNLPVPGLKLDRCFFLTYQFQEFLRALSFSGRHSLPSSGAKSATMQWKFNQTFAKNKLKCKRFRFSSAPTGEKNDNPPKKPSISEKFLNEEKCHFEKENQDFVYVKNESPLASSVVGKLLTETQYDSVYSSRCNSHSTETISSCEDTGFHEKDHKNIERARFQIVGARPKVTLAK